MVTAYLSSACYPSDPLLDQRKATCKPRGAGCSTSYVLSLVDKGTYVGIEEDCSQGRHLALERRSRL